MFASLKQSIRQEISGFTIPFIAFGVALNLVIGQIVAILKIPLFLDSIGTVFIAVLCGPWAGMTAGIITNIVAGFFFSPAFIFFIPVVVAIGGWTGFVARRGLFKTTFRVVLAGLTMGLIAAPIDTPISAYVFGGITFSGPDFVVILFRSLGFDLVTSVLLSSLMLELVDKTLTYVFAFLLARRLPYSLLIRFPYSDDV
jgi:energy-coupling factor transport system substrate-specific component